MEFVFTEYLNQDAVLNTYNYYFGKVFLNMYTISYLQTVILLFYPQKCTGPRKNQETVEAGVL